MNALEYHKQYEPSEFLIVENATMNSFGFGALFFTMDAWKQSIIKTRKINDTSRDSVEKKIIWSAKDVILWFFRFLSPEIRYNALENV